VVPTIEPSVVKNVNGIVVIECVIVDASIVVSSGVSNVDGTVVNWFEESKVVKNVDGKDVFIPISSLVSKFDVVIDWIVFSIVVSKVEGVTVDVSIVDS
jgi:hypothetical protein